MKTRKFLGALAAPAVCAAGFVVSAAAQSGKRVLFVVSAADHVTGADGRHLPSGFWADEFLIPCRTLKDSGASIVVATPGGVVPTVDPRSLRPPQGAKVLEGCPEYRTPVSLSSLGDAQLGTFDAVFYPGGHAPMQDLIYDADSGRILRYFHAAGKPTALLCHAPAALLAARTPAGWPYSGYLLTAFSDSEEKKSEIGRSIPLWPEDALKAAGARYMSGRDGESFVIADRELLTGQNPESSAEIATRLLKLLGNGAAPYYRVWRGFSRPELSPGQFLQGLPPFVSQVQASIGARGVAYVPAVTPSTAPAGVPSELAIVAFPTKDAYDAFLKTPDGTKYADAHWVIFQKPGAFTKSGAPEAFKGALAPDVAYDVLQVPLDWQSADGRADFFLGALGNKPDLRKLADWVKRTKKDFAKKGLDGFIVVTDGKAFIASWRHWRTAKDEFNAKISKDAASLRSQVVSQVTPLIETETEDYAGRSEPGHAYNVRLRP